MRYDIETTRLLSVTLIIASMMVSVTMPVQITLARSGPERAVKPSVSNDALPASIDPALQARAHKAYGQLPLSFEANRGQTDAAVKFLSRGSAYTLFLTQTEAVMKLRDEKQSHDLSSPQSSVLRMKLAGANPRPQIEGEDQLPGRSNYLIGNDPQKWQKNVSLYAKVRYTDVYPGINLLYYGNQQQLEYDFIVAPFADTQMIALDFEGADGLRLDVAGNLVLRTGAGEVVHHAPVIYQESEGVRQMVSGRYIIRNKQQIGFEVAAYDRSRPLMIDPVVHYSTNLGGKDLDGGNGIAVDSKGNAYVVGQTASIDFPIKNPFDSTLSGPADVFVTKFTTDGSALVYSTRVGGRFTDIGRAIAVTSDGRACITGATGDEDPGVNTNNFPLTSNAFQNASGSANRFVDAFVTVLNDEGDDLVYSSFFGGSKTRQDSSRDEGRGIALDNTGNVYITGQTASFDLPIKNAFQTLLRPTSAAFIAKFNPQATLGSASLLYSSYFGCHSGLGVEDEANGIAVDKFGIAYIVGESRFNQFFPSKSPSSLPPFQKRDPGGTSAFIAKFDCAAKGNASLIYATLLGGSDDDRALAVAVDAGQRTYITGSTRSSDFPLKNPFDSTIADLEGFVVKMNADGTALFYSSFLGGSGIDGGNSIAIDSQGNAYVAGTTESATEFPLLNAFQPTKGAGLDTFVTKVSAVPSTSVSPHIIFSSFLGGNGNDLSRALAVGPKKSVFVTGFAGAGFPTTPGAFQPNDTAGFDAFATKIAEVNADTVGTFRPSDLTFQLRNSNTDGPPDISFGPNFYEAGDLPVTGDFNGDGIDTTGIFRSVNSGSAFLVSDLTNGSLTTGAFLGQAGDLPIVGDWDGDGKDGIGVFRPSAGKFFLRNQLGFQIPRDQVDITVTFGLAGDTPLAGDWDGDGDDTIGVFRNSQRRFLLRNILNAAADINVQFGIAGDVPITGDWDGDGDDTIGVFRNSQHKFFLRDVNTSPANLFVDFGATNDLPLAGDWDGLSSNRRPNSGVNDPADGASAAGQLQQFVTTCSDPDGWRNIHTIDFKIAKSDGQGDGVPVALWVQFDQDSNVIRFYDPETRTWSEGALGANLVLSSRFAELHLAGTSIQGSGPTGPSVQVTWQVLFKEAAVRHHYKQYLRIEDDGGLSTDFDKVGSWSVTR